METNPYESPQIVANDDGSVVGYTYPRTLRMIGVVNFFMLGPLFIWLGIQEGYFFDGPQNLKELLLAVATPFMLALFMWGLATNWMQTRITPSEIRWGLFRPQRLAIGDIDYVASVSDPPVCMRVRTRSGKEVKVYGGTEALYGAFLHLQARLPPPGRVLAEDALSHDAGEQTVTGYSFSLGARIMGALGFLTFTPGFLWIWIDDPNFVSGPIDGSEIFMAVVTLGMISLGVCGLLMNWLKTSVSATEIRWGLGLRRSLLVADLAHVHSVSESPPRMRIVTRTGRRFEIYGGSEAHYRAFLQLQARFPHPAAATTR